MDERLINIWSDYRYLIALGAFLLWALIIAVILRYVYYFVLSLARKTKTDIDELILKEARLPATLATVLAGLPLVAGLFDLPEKYLRLINHFLQVSFLLLFILFLSRVLLLFLKRFTSRNEAAQPFVPAASRFLNVVIWGVAILVVMDAFGISVTPLLATLGIGGLAIGLALQDTLANFFAGTYILLSQPVRMGDYIRLESGEDGYVVSIGWRETRLRTLPNNIIVVPNQKLSQMVITNYYLPDREMACLVQVGVSYDSDLEKVERVTVETGREVLKRTTGGVKTFEPFIRYHTFADFSINFTVILRVSEFVDKYLVAHEFIKTLHRRYKQEGIEIPFPIRTVKLSRDAG